MVKRKSVFQREGESKTLEVSGFTWIVVTPPLQAAPKGPSLCARGMVRKEVNQLLRPVRLGPGQVGVALRV